MSVKKIIFIFFAFILGATKAQTLKPELIIAGTTIAYKTLKSKTQLIVIKLKYLLENKKLLLSDTSFVIEKYTFSIYIGNKLIEFKENGNLLSEDIIDELNELEESKEKKFNVYIQEIVASNSDDKELKIPDEKFILEK